MLVMKTYMCRETIITSSAISCAYCTRSSKPSPLVYDCTNVCL